MALPLLPGYSFADPTKRDFKKTQAFGFKNGMVVHNTTNVDLDENDAISELPPFTLSGPMSMTSNNRKTEKLDPYIPSDLKYYKKVLQFDGFWQEKIGHETRDRGACIHYFLEDDTIQVTEPKQPNSGIMQGIILGRQKIPLNSSTSSSAPFQTMLNSNPADTRTGERAKSPNASPTVARENSTLNNSTKGGVRDPNNYLASLSLTDSPNSTRSVSPNLRTSNLGSPTMRNSDVYNTTAYTPAPTKAPTFFHWRDLSVGKEVVFFGRTYMIMDADLFTHQFYNDQGVELPSAIPLPSSLTVEQVAPSTRLLSHDSRPTEERYRLRKFLENDRKVLRFYCLWDDTVTAYGERRPFILHYFLVDDMVELREVLGVNSGRDPATTFMKKQRLPKKPTNLHDLKNAEFYTDADLRIGDTINVFGRKFLLYDADPFTRQYYQDMYDIKDFPVVQVEEQVRVAIAREIPEHSGIGSEEDTLSNCISLVPKPPKKIVKAHATTDVMRFTAQLEEGKKGDEERRFVVSVFLEDDTLSVFENPLRGVKGGKFMERRKLKNPRTNTPYQPLDFFVGALIEVFAHKFRLIDADSLASRFIQEHEEEYAEIAASSTVEDVPRAPPQSRAGVRKY